MTHLHRRDDRDTFSIMHHF